MAASETTTNDLRERVSRLEGGYEHLATKADVVKLEARIAEMETSIAQLEARLLLRFGGMLIASTGITIAVLRLLG